MGLLHHLGNIEKVVIDFERGGVSTFGNYAYLELCQASMFEHSCKNKEQILAISYFRKKIRL